MAAFSNLNFNPGTLARFGWKTPIRKLLSCYFQIFCVCTPFKWFFCWFQQFFIEFRKNASCDIIYFHLTSESQILKKEMFRVCWNSLWIILVYIGLFLSNLWQSNENTNSFLIVIKKKCLRQQIINGNEVMIFWYFERTTQ